jgi:hypothetical protein
MGYKQGSAPTHSDGQYLAYDPGSGDNFPVEVECRKTALVITRKVHQCWSCSGNHEIPAGTRVFRESGKCEGKFGTSYSCLPCVDIALEPEYW